MASACGAHMLGKRGCVYHFSISAVFAAAGVAIQLESQFEMFARQTRGFAGSNTPLASMYGNSLDIPECKYQDPGWAALAGVFAARSAALGETGLPYIFDVDLGLIRMRGIDHFEADARPRLWLAPVLADITYKPWPTCCWMHHSLTALVKAIAKANIS